MIAGQAIGGIIYRVLGPWLMFLIDGLSYLFSALSESFISIPSPVRKAHQPKPPKALMRSFWNNTKEGFHYAWAHPGLRSLFFSVAIINFFMMPYIVLLPFYVEETLGRAIDWYGYLAATVGVGSVIGYILAGTVKLSPSTRKIVLPLVCLGIGALEASLGFLRSAPLALGFFLLVGALIAIYSVYALSTAQVSIPTEMRGRVLGMMGTLSNALNPLGMGAAGIAADLTRQNIPIVFIGTGVLAVVLSVPVVASRAYRDFMGSELKL